MVRNEGGGNKMKHVARKHVNCAKNQQTSKILRTAGSPDEKYGYVLKLTGNSMCIVKCVDGYERLCFIRGKFSGRSKRENTITSGTWVLVGLRQWDSEKEFASKLTKTSDKKLQKCDLLEIYSSSEREKLRVQERIFQDVSFDGDNSDDEFQSLSKHAVEFKDQATLEYQEIVEQGGTLSRMKKTSYADLYSNISDSDDDDDDDDDDDTTSNDDDDDTISETETSVSAPAAAPASEPAPASPPKSHHHHHHQHHQHQHQHQPHMAEIDIDDI